jgi:alkanesulfonate monooxygenase SsuD/methylene tetrahydromethanopterin reductase-like flavin-dependent oxidoreductase (luciferase family)
VLPKPYKLPHPAMWVAAGSPSTYERAGGLGMGVLGFNVGSVLQLEPHVKAYKAAVADADPVGDFVNDNVMITSTLVCHEDGRRAREIACEMGLGYLQSLVFHKLDTFPRPPEIPAWPELIPEPTMADVDWRIGEGYLICGDPDECAEQLRGYAEVGCDQLVFGTPIDMSWEDARHCLQVFGDEVIPRFDTDPVHSTTRYRDDAAARLGLGD